MKEPAACHHVLQVQRVGVSFVDRVHFARSTVMRAVLTNATSRGAFLLSADRDERPIHRPNSGKSGFAPSGRMSSKVCWLSSVTDGTGDRSNDSTSDFHPLAFDHREVAELGRRLTR